MLRVIFKEQIKAKVKVKIKVKVNIKVNVKIRVKVRIDIKVKVQVSLQAKLTQGQNQDTYQGFETDDGQGQAQYMSLGQDNFHSEGLSKINV